jgi:hypothetical protein
MGIVPYAYYFPDQEDANNVGLFGICWAKQEYGSDQIFLVGMEHEGIPYDEYVYEEWKFRFWQFVKRWPPHTIINCSQGGSLYDDNKLIYAATLDWIEKPKRRHGDVLVIGGAPSLQHNIQEAKKFKGKVVVIDSTSSLAVEKGVKFDYVVTLEKCCAATDMLLSYRGMLKRVNGKFTLVYAPNQEGKIGDLMAVYKKITDNLLPFKAKYRGLANVGLFGIQFAVEYLLARRVFLIGFDHYGGDVFGRPYEQEIFDSWLADFRDYLDHGVKAQIINCSPETQFKDERIKYGTIQDLKNK